MLHSTLFIFLQFTAYAQASNAEVLTVFCDQSPIALEECADKVHAALDQINCKVETTATQCKNALREDPKNPGSLIKSETIYCNVSSENCSRPFPGLVGGSNCYGSEKTEFLANSQVHLGYWTSPLAYHLGASPSKVLCIKR